MPSYCRFKPIECSYSESVSVSVPQNKIRGSAIQKKRGADVDFQAAWANVNNQEHQVSPRGASDWWRESVRKSVSVHQDKLWGSAISRHAVSPLSTEVVQIDSFSFLNDSEKPTLIEGPHVAFSCVPYSLLLGSVRPLREHSRMGSALDRPHFRSRTGTDRLRPHF